MTGATSEDFIAVMRRFAAAVNVITIGRGAQRAGFTATAVMSLTADPPQIALAVNRGVTAFPLLRVGAGFCVNTLAAQHSELARRFAGAVKGSERFLTGEWSELATGAPVLDDALINLDCRIVQAIEFSSHVLFVGDVLAARMNTAQKPLLYVEGNWASLLPGANTAQGGFMQAVEQSIKTIDDAFTCSADPMHRLDRFVRGFTQVYIDQQRITRDYLTSEMYVSPENLASLNAAKQQFDRKLTELLEDGLRRGDFQLEDARFTALAISGMVAWLHRWFRADGRLSADDVARLFAQLVMRMVEPREVAL